MSDKNNDYGSTKRTGNQTPDAKKPAPTGQPSNPRQGESDKSDKE